MWGTGRSLNHPPHPLSHPIGAFCVCYRITLSLFPSQISYNFSISNFHSHFQFWIWISFSILNSHFQISFWNFNFNFQSWFSFSIFLFYFPHTAHITHHKPHKQAFISHMIKYSAPYQTRLKTPYKALQPTSPIQPCLYHALTLLPSSPKHAFKSLINALFDV
jgi:hypothetical protein